MSLQAYKSMMYTGGLLIVLSMAAIFADIAMAGAILFFGGLLTLLAGAVGYLWNGE